MVNRWSGFRTARVFLCTFFLASFALFGSACTQEPPPPPPQTFTAAADITFGAYHFTADITQTAPGTMEIAFTAPEELKGMLLTLEGESACLRYQALETSLPLQSLPQAGFASCLCQVLQQLALPEEGSFIAAEDGWKAKGNVNSMRYSAELAKDGSLRSLSVPMVSLHIAMVYDALTE